MKKEGTVESTVESTKSENETRRSSILKDSSVPDRKSSKAKVNKLVIFCRILAPDLI